MAVSPDQVKYMAHVLRAVGYPVGDGHTPGTMDQAFLTAYDQALPAIWGMVTNGEEGPLTVPMNNDAFEEQFRKRLTDAKLVPLQSYADGTSYLRPVIQAAEPNITDAMLDKATVKDFVGMLKKPDEMFAGLRAVEAERVLNKPSVSAENMQGQVIKASLQQPAQPAAAVQPAVQTVPQTGPAAASSPDLETAVKKLQKYVLAINNPDGQLTDDFKEKIQARLAAATGWNKADQGEYTKEFHQALMAGDTVFKDSPLAKLMTGFFNAGGDITAALTAPGSSANKNTSGTPANKKSADIVGTSQDVANAKKEVSEVEYATGIAKAFLSQVAEGVNKKRADVKEKAGLFGSMMIAGEDLPAPSSSESFDEASRTSLQAVLKTFQKQLKLTDEQIYNYTPAVGEEIEKNFGNVSKNMTDEQKQALDKIESEDKKKKGIAAIIESLNILHGKDKLPPGKLYEGGPAIQLSGMGASILNWVFRLIGGIFPGAVPMMHNMVRQYTGGLDYNDLVPAEHRNQDVSAAAGKYANLPPEQQLRMTYLDAYDDVKKQNPSDTPAEIQQKLDKAMQRGLKGLNVLPFGDDASRADYQKAFDTAMEKAAGAEHPEMAAGVFSDTFLGLWKSERHANRDGNLNIGGHGQDRIGPDKNEFKIGREDGKPKFNMNDLKETYDELSKRQADGNMAQRPLVFFQGNNGVTMVAGMTAENFFTVQPVTKEVAAELDRALQNPDQKAAREDLAKAAQKNPALSALSVMAGGYGEGYGLEQMRRDISAPLPFEQVRRNIYGGKPPPSDQERLQKPQLGSEAGGYETGKRGPSDGGRPRLSRAEVINDFSYRREEGIERENAVRGWPQLHKASYVKDGQISLVALEKMPERIYETRDQKYNGSLKEAVAVHKNSFGQYNVTDEYREFMSGFEAFVDSEKNRIGKSSSSEKMDEYIRLKLYDPEIVKGKFPTFTKILELPAYQGKQLNLSRLVDDISKRIKPLDGTMYAQGGSPSYNNSSGGGGFLSEAWNNFTGLFNGKSNQPASETGGVRYVEKPAEPEKPYEGRFRNAQESREKELGGYDRKATSEAAPGGEMFPAAQQSRVREFCENCATITGSEMQGGLPPGGGGPSVTHRNAMRPAA